jgi:hypothetical protein
MSETQTEKKARRSRGEHSVYFDAARGRWMAEATVGYDGRGKRIRRFGSGTSKSAALDALGKRVKAYKRRLQSGWNWDTATWTRTR